MPSPYQTSQVSASMIILNERKLLEFQKINFKTYVLWLPVKAVNCETTLAQFCPVKKTVRHCPRWTYFIIKKILTDYTSYHVVNLEKKTFCCLIMQHLTRCVFSRLYCPRNCLYNSYARVIGTRYYSDVSPFKGPFTQNMLIFDLWSLLSHLASFKCFAHD